MEVFLAKDGDKLVHRQQLDQRNDTTNKEDQSLVELALQALANHLTLLSGRLCKLHNFVCVLSDFLHKDLLVSQNLNFC